MYITSLARVVHRTPTRVRIKISERRGEAEYFTALKRVLLDHPEVRKVEANPVTGSVIIWYVEGFDLSASGNRFLGLEIVEAPAPVSPGLQACRNVAAIDDRIRSMSRGEVGLASFLVKLVIAIATRQVGLQLVTWGAEVLVRAARERSSLIPAANPALTGEPRPQLLAA